VIHLEKTILTHLLNNEEYARKTIPFLKSEYFEDRTSRLIFEAVDEYVRKFNGFPTKEALVIEFGESKVTDEDYKNIVEQSEELFGEVEKTDYEWLINKTEKWCQERAVYLAIMESIGIIDGKSSLDKGAIPDILSDALSVSFDTHIGHDFLEDAEARYEFYHHKAEKLPFDLDYFNKITKGGLERKTLNIIMAGTGVGKSLAMCHMAAANLSEGRNVLYVTMEMAEEKISQRIDANLLNVPIQDLEELPKELFQSKVDKLRAKTPGKLIVKEYPTAQAGVGHFRHLLNELKLKRNFVPDIIYVDYLNICLSQRVRASSNANSYTIVKAIAEELRGLAVEKNVPIVSATQTTRAGYTSSDPGLEDTSESFGLPATADLMIALISTEDMEALNQIMVKQLKNRYNDPSLNKRFVVGVDRARMRLYDVEQSAQADVLDGPILGSEYENNMNDKFSNVAQLQF
jgi:replicative DNA helicase